MIPHYQDTTVTLHHGDCLDVLRELPDASVDAVVTDPPYGLEFMGREWDGANGFRRSLNPNDAGRDNAFGRTSRTSPEYRTDSKAKAGMSGTGYTDGAQRLERPSFMGGTNPRCLVCNKWQRGGNPCTCESPEWTQERLVRLHSFQEWCEAWATECLRVLKPGGHLLAFGGTRTWHRLACAIEDAGFEVRDSIAWLYGSGFPKSLDVSKAIDKAAGAEREVVGQSATITPRRVESSAIMPGGLYRWGDEHYAWEDLPPNAQAHLINHAAKRGQITAPATPDAERWQGWGTALKPAHEPIVVARKPLSGTVAATVLEHGTGALNIDGCRVEGPPSGLKPYTRNTVPPESQAANHREVTFTDNPAGRWPANVVLDESQAAALDQMSGTLTSGANPTQRGVDGDRTAYGDFAGQEDANPQRGVDRGGASRFFYIAREDTPCSDESSDSHPSTDTTGTTDPAASGAPAGAWSSAAPVEQPTSTRFRYEAKADASERVRIDGTAHPTVKPLALMRWLVRLVTPPGGTILEPFAGSGTTIEAAILEGFKCIAIEREADYLPLITQRINRRRDPVAAVRSSGEDAGLFDLLGEEPA